MPCGFMALRRSVTWDCQEVRLLSLHPRIQERRHPQMDWDTVYANPAIKLRVPVVDAPLLVVERDSAKSR